jgi:hypothetical protein
VNSSYLPDRQAIQGIVFRIKRPLHLEGGARGLFLVFLHLLSGEDDASHESRVGLYQKAIATLLSIDARY